MVKQYGSVDNNNAKAQNHLVDVPTSQRSTLSFSMLVVIVVAVVDENGFLQTDGVPTLSSHSPKCSRSQQ